MVKRAAEALGNKVDNETTVTKVNETITTKRFCNSPRHMVVCNNCNESLFVQIYDLLSCESMYIENLVCVPALYKALIDSFSCRTFGLDFKTNFRDDSSYIDNLHYFFPERYLGAMCNEAAFIQNQRSLNVTHEYLNVTKKLTKDKIISLDLTSPDFSLKIGNDTLPDNHIKIDNATLTINTTEEITLVDQIKPTKSMNSDKLVQTENISVLSNEVDEVETELKPAENLNNKISYSGENFSTIASPSVPEATVLNESSETFDDHIDHVMSSDINSDSQGIITPSSTTSNLPQAPKESIFLRLSNRIKVRTP